MNRRIGAVLLALALGCARRPATGAPATVRDYACRLERPEEPLRVRCEFVDAGSEVRVGCGISGRPLFALVGWNRRAELFVNADDAHPAARYTLRHHGRFSPAVIRGLVEPASDVVTAGDPPAEFRASRLRGDDRPGGTRLALPGGHAVACTPDGPASAIALPPPPSWLRSMPARGADDLLRRIDAIGSAGTR